MHVEKATMPICGEGGWKFKKKKKEKKKLVNKGADVTRKRSWMDNIYKTIYISKDTSQKLPAKG